MKILRYIALFAILSIITGCITQFIPKTGNERSYYVVDGMITDQEGIQTIRLSQSVPLGSAAEFKPLIGCTVWITDDKANKYPLTPSGYGNYNTSNTFKGVIGRRYTLYIEIVHYQQPGNRRIVDYLLQSRTMEMLPVPGIDSIYYEKVELKNEMGLPVTPEGCQIYLNTSDPLNTCKYFRWNFMETWKVVTPTYPGTIHNICWVTNNSTDIHVKSALGLGENKLDHVPVTFFTNETDRLLDRYRIQVDQYSISEDEYNFWNALDKITESTGGIYDRIPSPVIGNMFCFADPGLPVFGYFSVSGKKTKAIYIRDYLHDQFVPYLNCLRDTVWNECNCPFNYEGLPIQGLWVVDDNWLTKKWIILNKYQGCIDCSYRGTTVKPDFWKERYEK